MSKDKDTQPRTWRRTAVVLAIIFLFDLGYSGQGIFSLAVAAIGLILLTVGALWSLLQGKRPLARSRALRASAYLVFGIAAYNAVQFHQATAQHHAADIIAACEGYKIRHGMLPTTLQQLVPEFLPAVPRAKYTMAYGDFTYVVASETAHTLMYISLPPFGRRAYHFEQAVWSQFD